MTFRTALTGIAIALAATAAWPQDDAARWWKGNLHTHSHWSDGDDYPEPIAAWYKEKGYHFLTLSDHNVLSVGENWIDPVKSRGGIEALEKYIAKFGADWVETRVEDETLKVRLKPLNEFRSLFEEPGRFLLIQGEEITDRYTSATEGVFLPVHLNGINLIELIMPKHGDSVVETLQNNIDAVLEQRERTGQPMFPHINHPNFGYALTAEDMAGLDGEKFFEVYNGHPSVNNLGNEVYPDTERMWDIILTKRLGEYKKPVMYGIATDDSHSYHTFSSSQSNPGRGWVMVKANALTPEHIVLAMERGDFYASSGVTLGDLQVSGKAMEIEIEAEEGVEYTTYFYGTRKGYDASTTPQYDPKTKRPITAKYSMDVGEQLAKVDGVAPRYEFAGDELYVRAVVRSTKMKANPYAEGEVERAWIQPVALARSDD